MKNFKFASILVAMFLLPSIFIACQRTNTNQGTANSIAKSSLETTNSNTDVDEWLIPLISEYLQDDEDVAPTISNPKFPDNFDGITNVTVVFQDDSSGDTPNQSPTGNIEEEVEAIIVGDNLMYQGDIILGKVSDNSLSTQGLFTSYLGNRWSNRTVPYTIASSVPTATRSYISQAVNHWNNNTNIQLVNWTGQQDYVEFTYQDGCWSYVGRIGGRQEISLGAGCYLGAAIHEIGHAVGMHHEQSRPDRDSYITINLNNVRSTPTSLRRQFDKKSSQSTNSIGVYDFDSIMHYPAYLPSSWVYNTSIPIIVPRNNNININALGNGNALSPKDIAAVNQIYPLSIAPTISSFNASPSSITVGQTSTLNWSVYGTQPITLTMQPNIGNIGSSALVVAPTQTTTYQLTASNSAGSTSRPVTVTVNPISNQKVYSDFNGDGFADLAIGAPGESIGTITDAGAVHVIFGDSGELNISSGVQDFYQNRSDIPGSSEINDNYGAALAVGDFDNDGFYDLVIGAPGESIGTKAEAGAIHVIYGSANRLTPSSGVQDFYQDRADFPASSEAGDKFGSAFAVGDFNGDNFDDLAIGTPGEDIGTVADAGTVSVLYGSNNGLAYITNTDWYQNAPGVPDTSEVGDHYGGALAAGDFNGDGFDELAIGVPGESIGSLSSAGAVHIYKGSSSGLTTNGIENWYQNRSDVPASSEAGDLFGAALAAGDFNGDGKDDLAIGVPGEAIGSVSDAGTVTILYGTNNQMQAQQNDFYQGRADIPGSSEVNDWYGASLAVGDFDGNGKDDLAIGAPGEGIGSLSSAGAVHIIYSDSSGLNPAIGVGDWYQNRSDIYAGSEVGDLFGAALTAADFNGDGKSDLAIGVPGESIGSVPNAGTTTVLYSSSNRLKSISQSDIFQSRSDIPGSSEAGDSYGYVNSSYLLAY